VRASGCNLRCWFCDTPYTSWEPEGNDWSVDDIVGEVQRLQLHGELPDRIDHEPAAGQGRGDLRHVVITGGEPMLFAELIPRSQRLRASGLHITVETA